MRALFSRLALVALWLLHLLPLRLLAPLGEGVGMMLWWLGRERRCVTLTNLRLCFPELDEARRAVLARRTFAAFGRSFLERGILWWSRPQRIRRLVTVDGLEHLRAAQGVPTILLVPHFVGLDVGWSRLAQECDMVSVYSNQKNPVFNAVLLRGRLRFGQQKLLSRQEGMRGAVKAIKEGRPFYYLPDMDYGRRDAVFVPFFGVQAATITGLSRLTRLTGAQVLPVVVTMLPGGRGYRVEILAAWTDWPGEDVEADTRRMNTFVEGAVRLQPEQYFWLHKRFKTRPEGAARLY